jgi:hypothetical protein
MPGPTAETYEGLQQAYDFFNAQLFAGVLPGALITLQREHNTYGYFSPERFATHEKARADEIAMNPVFFGVRPLRTTLSTLVHEMVHQWQQRNGTPGRGRYHNREWADRMEQIGLMPTSTGQPGGRRVGDTVTHYIIDGGSFDRVCAELLTNDFKLAWFDRFPPRRFVAALGGVDNDGSEDEDSEGSGRPASKSKTKYTCPLCNANVWGKPGLAVLCGVDFVQFEIAD